jgi:hypothetical protein
MKKVIVKDVKIGEEVYYEDSFRMSPFSKARCEESGEGFVNYFVERVDFNEVENEPKGKFEVIENEKMKVFIPKEVINKMKEKITAKAVFEFVLDKLFVRVDVEDRGGNIVTYELVSKDKLASRPDVKNHGSHYWRVMSEDEEEELQEMLEFIF